MHGLRVLVLANNELDSTVELNSCRSLEVVDLSRNRFHNVSTVQPLISANPIIELDLRNNEVSDKRQALDAIIVACPTIHRLNGRELTNAERLYLQQLHRLGKRTQPW